MPGAVPLEHCGLAAQPSHLALAQAGLTCIIWNAIVAYGSQDCHNPTALALCHTSVWEAARVEVTLWH